MDQEKLDPILELMVEFAQSRNDILALALCGSWARGEAGLESDIDLSIIVKDKLKFKSTEWIEELLFSKIQESVKSFRDEVYGVTWSRHVLLKSGIEIEFGFANTSWADSDNLDDGTKKVVSDGYKILYDPQQILKNLIEKVDSIQPHFYKYSLE